MGSLVTLDANEAVAHVAYLASEVVAIYPITPSSPMGEWADQWASEERPNLWGTVPQIVEMQSEGGVAGAIHGALVSGSLATTFTASQGLLLMLPNMFKIAGELTPCVIHVAARTLATHALSIFGDHSDVMAARSTGWAMLCSSSVQEAADMAAISHSATLRTRLPFLHFFDGFRTSHEIGKIDLPGNEEILGLLDVEAIEAHRARGMNPENPAIRGTAQNPDVFFQAREACNPWYDQCPAMIEATMEQFAETTGRRYGLFDYYGDPNAERVIVLMGSGVGAAEEAVDALRAAGEKIGIVKVRLYRPFVVEKFIAALPASVRSIAVLDRTKEPGAIGEPLYQDVMTALAESFGEHKNQLLQWPRVIGGRYGLSSKEFTPAMVKAVFDELRKPTPKNHFTVGIKDDVSGTSLDYDPAFCTEDKETVRAVFFGLGSDGTVGANKNSIKIIGEETPNYAQGYFVYDSKKSGSTTTSHLRFGPRPIRSTYLITRASFVAVHHFNFLRNFDVLKDAEAGATVLLNAECEPHELWDRLPRRAQQHLIEKKLRLYTIDAYRVAREAELGGRINTVMQVCFFALSGVLPRGEAIEAIKESIRKTYGKRGEAVVSKNIEAVDNALSHLHEVAVPDTVTAEDVIPRFLEQELPDFVQRVTARMMLGEGDLLPVSAMTVDGGFPSGTTKYEKRNIAQKVPAWDPSVCIQCGKCVMVCPHAVIRGKLYEEGALVGAPECFQKSDSKWPEYKNLKFTLAIAAEDCTGCSLCVEVCPAKNKSAAGLKAINMVPHEERVAEDRLNWDFFLGLPEFDRTKVNASRVKDLQLLQPLFEFSGACAGCGETPYLKLLSQLFGDRTVVANATGCSSIYGGNLPTTPWTKNGDGRGPAWANSLFEDNAEFGLGIRLALDKQNEYARELVREMSPMIGEGLAKLLLKTDQRTEKGIADQRKHVELLRRRLAEMTSPRARDLATLADALVRRSTWIIGGDGWAYDIGYGGLDHVLASGQNVNILVLDTEVYSNTGGQQSKSTPMGAVAKFAMGGKRVAKKDLALLAMGYGHVYVARVAMGAGDQQTIKAFLEAEAHNGPSLILAYSHCIAHGYDLALGMEQQKKAVQSGHWPLMRYNPALATEGKNPLVLDSKAPSLPLRQYIQNEMRYRMLMMSKPEVAQELITKAQDNVIERWRFYEKMAAETTAPAAATTTTQPDGKN